MKTVRYWVADVFTCRPLSGNPCAIVLDGDPLTDGEMLRIAAEMNLSETSFVQTPSSPGVDYRFRFFTPKREIPFAGHPTVGTVYALMDPSPLHPDPPDKPVMDPYAGESDSIPYTIRIEMGTRVIPVEALVRKGAVERVVMTQGKPEFSPIPPEWERAASALGLARKRLGIGSLPMEVVSTGLPHLFVPVSDLSSMRDIRPNPEAVGSLCRLAGVSCLMAFTLKTVEENSAVHSRMFAPELGILEDPVMGSGSGALGAYLVKNGAFSAGGNSGPVFMVNEQGYEMGRPGKVSIEVEIKNSLPERVRISGQAVLVGAGTLRIE